MAGVEYVPGVEDRIGPLSHDDDTNAKCFDALHYIFIFHGIAFPSMGSHSTIGLW